MRVDSWPLNRFMQLPDRCFGRRWFVGMISGLSGPGADYIVADVKLPSRMVVWGFYCSVRQEEMTSWEITYRLGPVQVYNHDLMAPMERVFPNLGHSSFFNEIWSQNGEPLFVMGLRTLVEPLDRRLVMAITTNNGTGYREAAAGLYISSIPKEVPDWLVTAEDRTSW